ncbi:ATP-binding protein [Termitidicoccus mucosus]
MKRFGLRTLSSQLIGVMLLAIALSQGVSLYVFHREHQRSMRGVLRDECLGRIASAMRLVQVTPPDQRAATLAAVSTPLTRYWLTPDPPASSAGWQQSAREQLLRHTLSADHGQPTPSLFQHDPMLDRRSAAEWEELPADTWLVGLPVRQLDLAPWNGFGFALRLGGGDWLNTVFAKPDYLTKTRLTTEYYAALIATALLFAFAAWLIARRISCPLRTLARSAERLGRGESPELLPEEGPDDIRATAITFNRMQVRLRRFVEDRTQMIAAISHDLRTPITSLRLRAEYVEDPEMRENDRHARRHAGDDAGRARLCPRGIDGGNHAHRRYGDWLNTVFAKPDYLTKTRLTTEYYAALIATALLFAFAAWLIARRISCPLRTLARSAERLGRGESPELLPEEGPDDIRATAITFNRMQVRLRRFVEDRTQMIAAISHDLRTPITSLRLRAEYVEDPEMREKMIGTLDGMQAMTQAVLAFAREESTAETTRTVDIDALIESVCDDLAGLGWDVKFADGHRIPFRCRPDGLKRALANIIENAVRYGQRARVHLDLAAECLGIVIDDDGPGIAAEDRERVFAPFFRLESSRNRATGGVGLGLAIARSIVRAHGGDIVLANRAEGGLRATIRLPVAK